MPGARRHSHVLKHDGQKPRRYLLARGDNGIIFAGVMHWRCFLAPGHQLVSGAGHGRDDDGHMVARLHLAQDMARHIADTPDIRNRSASKLHNQTAHRPKSFLIPKLWLAAKSDVK